MGKKGQVTIPRNILRKVGIQEEGPLLVSTTENGGILLRPAGVYPIELYTEERMLEFEQANEVPDSLLDQAEEHIEKQRRKKTGG